MPEKTAPKTKKHKTLERGLCTGQIRGSGIIPKTLTKISISDIDSKVKDKLIHKATLWLCLWLY